MFTTNFQCPKCQSYTPYEWVGKATVNGKEHTNLLNCVVCGVMLMTHETLIITLPPTAAIPLFAN